MTEKDQAAKLRALCFAANIAGTKPFCRIHHEKDWSQLWKKGWKPFALTPRIHVVPLWQESRIIPKSKIPIYLDTTNAFGTGLHETTRFSSQIIERLSGNFDTFLDVGTGSGILVIVAFLSGAKKCVGFDIDPLAVKVARQNLKANGQTCVLKVCDVKEFKPVRPFDLVAANLVSPDLIEFRDRILSFVRPGGALVVSGVSLKNIPRVVRAFKQAGHMPVNVVSGQEWAAIHFNV